MSIYALNAFSDNYIWVGATSTPNSLFCVDPGDSTPILDYTKAHNTYLSHILLTHHHADHTGGIIDLQQAFPEVIIYGPDDNRLPPLVSMVQDGETIQFGEFNFQVLKTPGHTLSHLCYYEPTKEWLFCGDTLFSAGCGRQFEGTMSMLHNSIQLLKQLPPTTQVFCGHEYTWANLQFALTVEPNNPDIKKYYQQLQQRTLTCTLPSTIGLERKINPFMRTTANSMYDFARNEGIPINDSLAIFTRLRERKDCFISSK